MPQVINGLLLGHIGFRFCRSRSTQRIDDPNVQNAAVGSLYLQSDGPRSVVGFAIVRLGSEISLPAALYAGDAEH